MSQSIEDRLTGLEAELHVLRAKEEIREVLARFCRGVDRLDREILRSCYHDDANDDHTPFIKGTADEWADYAIQLAKEALRMSFYAVSNSLIEVEGAVAWSESYVISAKELKQPDKEGKTQLRLSGVRFLDKFELREGAWKIKYRRFIPEWGVFVPIPQEELGPFKIAPVETRPIAKRDRTDPSYDLRRLGLT